MLINYYPRFQNTGKKTPPHVDPRFGVARVEVPRLSPQYDEPTGPSGVVYWWFVPEDCEELEEVWEGPHFQGTVGRRIEVLHRDISERDVLYHFLKRICPLLLTLPTPARIYLCPRNLQIQFKWFPIRNPPVYATLARVKRSWYVEFSEPLDSIPPLESTPSPVHVSQITGYVLLSQLLYYAYYDTPVVLDTK